MNTLSENRYTSFVGVCPKTAQSKGYTICKYVNWIGMHGEIGDKNNYRKHLHVFLSKAHFYNFSIFRLGAWKLNVNTINLKHINKNMHFCHYCSNHHHHHHHHCSNRNNNIMEDVEHVIFGCPEYETCRLKYPELFNGSENNFIALSPGILVPVPQLV